MPAETILEPDARGAGSPDFRYTTAMGGTTSRNCSTTRKAKAADRDGQFRHINGRAKARRHRGEPAISVDTKKKEVLGNLKNAGETYRPKGDPRKVKTHDFPDPELGKAVPYGV